ncbi:hypothetical protein QBC34DRAFT_464318 [Podospora aff. communis PSN243]|uniref:F-box domain-containing protein n=1 Tax=Podospora aff. communis PSN243 TaxID=3040156 RepID=A0AAV9GNV3_9PEZI|nr:hypothetical protein QBC34DRAFT_464318 [Podospora aff. communis PSN243]
MSTITSKGAWDARKMHDSDKIDGQDASLLFSIPLELQLDIYKNVFDVRDRHVWVIADNLTSHWQFKSTPCIAPPMTNRGKNKECDSDLQREAGSLWGPHWMCEDLMYFDNMNPDCDLVASESASFRHLSALLRLCKRVRQRLPSPYRFENAIWSRTTRLSITSRRPFSFFRAAERAVDPSFTLVDKNSGSDPAQIHNSMNTTDANTWVEIPSRILHELPDLRRFHIWLDYLVPMKWSVFNERAVLAPAKALKRARPELEVVCSLPDLSPKEAERHAQYLPVPPSDIEICRFVQVPLRH